MLMSKLDSFESVQVAVAGACGHGNELSLQPPPPHPQFGIPY
jgi:hypothetical protein